MGDSFPLPPPLAAIVEDMPLEELAFTPVPVKPRHDGWSPERQRAFIQRLALVGCVSAAARAVGKSRESAYRLLDHPGAASFAAAWQKALGWGKSLSADLAIERALVGERRGVYYKGRKVDEVIRYDNRLLIAALRRIPSDAASRGDPSAELRGLLDKLYPGAK